MFFRNSLAFSIMHEYLAIRSLVPSSFSKIQVGHLKFLIHVLLKPSMENFKHGLSSMGMRASIDNYLIHFCLELKVAFIAQSC